MWGEFEDDAANKKSAVHSPPSELMKNCDGVTEDSEVDDSTLPLRDRIIHHLAASTVVLKSQQRYEPDLTYDERKSFAEQFLDEKPGQFLYRLV